MTRMVAVSPSLRGNAPQLRSLCDALRGSGFDPYIVPTGRGVEETCFAEGLPHVVIGDNPGFGAAVTWGLDHIGDWDWALIINDDIELAPSALDTLVDALPAAARPALVYLDPVSPKAIPGVLSTLGQVSLWSAVLRRPARRPARRGTFRPFSIALVSRALWEELGGLDEEMPYTFEDADFARRALSLNAEVQYPSLDGVKHPASATSRRHVDAVLPVATWSAMSYLAKWYMPRPAARAACAGALLLRLPLVLVAPLDRVSHARGVMAAMTAILKDKRPSLPPFGSV